MAVFIPANETTLYSQYWRNGSLFDQFNPNYTSFPGNDADQHVVLSILANNLASITFNVSNNSIQMSAFALSETIFDPNAIQFPVHCAYPLSGQYDTLSRALFYVLIVFSLILRRHVWLSVAALGTAMTYAAVSAVHLFALVANFEFGDPGNWNRESGKAYIDVDIIGIFPILSASAIMLTPIMMWSTSVRKHHAQVVILYWGLLIFAALLTEMGVIFHASLKHGFAQNFIPSFATCLRSPECQPIEPPNFLTEDYYNRCNCIDFCGTQGPAASMRKGASMTPYITTVALNKVLLSDGYWRLQAINLLALLFIILNGCLGVLASRFSQSEVRNALFCFFNADTRTFIKVLFEGKREDEWLERFGMENPDERITVWRRFRYFFAKIFAACFYMTAVMLTVICPAVFISIVVANELYVQIFPVSEHSDAVGAWGTWVGAALVVIAAVVDRYHAAWADSVLVSLEAVWRIIKYTRNERPGVHSNSDNKEWSVRRRIKLFFMELASPFIHGWYSTWRACWTGKTNLKLFALWWKDTEGQSRQTREDMERVWEDEETKSPGGKPICWCRMCEDDAKKLNPDNNNTADGPLLTTAIQRFRTRVNKNRGNKYQIVSTGSEAPTVAPSAIEIPKPIPLVTLLPLSPSADAVGQTGGGRPISSSPSSSIDGEISDVQVLGASPRPLSPTETVPIHRPTFPRQITDQTASPDVKSPDASSRPLSPTKVVPIHRSTFPTLSTDHTTVSDAQASDASPRPLSPTEVVPIHRSTFPSLSTGQTRGSDSQAPDAPSHPSSPTKAVPLPRRALARQSTDMATGSDAEAPDAPLLPAAAVSIPRRALARQSTDQTTGSAAQASDTPSYPSSPTTTVPIPRRALARQSIDQTVGSDAQSPDAPSRPLSTASAVPIRRRPLARQSIDQNVGLDVEEGPSQAPRSYNYAPAIQPASPEEDETPPRPRSTSPDELSQLRDGPGSLTW